MEPIPYSSFFTGLKNNGFSVTQNQVVSSYKIILQYADKVNKQEDLQLYLAPVFASSEDEQRLFGEIFNSSFDHRDFERIKPGFRKRFDAQGKKHPLLVIGVYSMIAMLVIYCMVRSYRHYTAIDRSKLRVYMVDTRYKNTLNSNNAVLYTNTGESVQLKPVCYYKNSQTNDFETSQLFDWGDGTQPSDTSFHIYQHTGEYRVLVNTDIAYNGKFIEKIIDRFRVIVCDSAGLSVTSSEKTDTIPTGKKIQLRAVATGAKGYHIEWLDEGSFAGNDEKISLQYSKPGSHKITCRLMPLQSGSRCAVERSLHLTVVDPAASKRTQTGNPVITESINDREQTEKQKNDKTFLYALYLCLAAVFTVCAVYFFILYQKAIVVKTGWKLPVHNQHLQVAVAPADTSIHLDIQFPPVNYHVIEQPALHELAKNLRYRVNDNIWQLDIRKTIHSTINAGGLLQVISSPVSRQPDYLILVGTNDDQLMITKLVAYFTTLLKKHTLSVDTYYFSNNSLLCYNANEPQGTSFEKLSIRYNKHVLLVFAEATLFTAMAESMSATGYKDLLQHWQYKALITPGSFLNWKDTEKTLAAELPVVPFDLKGLLQLPAILQQEKNQPLFSSRLKAAAELYSVSPVTFEHINGLEAYCLEATWANTIEHNKPVNVLFEWVKALSVYPKIQWELIIVIGKAILEKYNMPQELNFTSLLRIARITWVNQAVFPDGTRLELLQKLPKDNERIAREAVLKLLNDVPVKDAEAGKTAYSEREIQIIVNEFNLYAHDPARYVMYKRARPLFEKIWKENLLKDETLLYYLTNKDRLWQTLVEHGSLPGNISLQQYFEASEIEESNLSRTYLWLTIISIMVLVSSVFALLILYRWDRIGL